MVRDEASGVGPGSVWAGNSSVWDHTVCVQLCCSVAFGDELGKSTGKEDREGAVLCLEK